MKPLSFVLLPPGESQSTEWWELRGIEAKEILSTLHLAAWTDCTLKVLAFREVQKKELKIGASTLGVEKERMAGGRESTGRRGERRSRP